MLSLSSTYLSLLRAADHPLAWSAGRELPPLPLAPFQYTIFGRLNSLQHVHNNDELISGIKNVASKTALMKATKQARRDRGAGAELSEEEKAAIQSTAANAHWIQEIQTTLAEARNDAPCRYLTFQDPLHPNGISRFHCIIKREEVEPVARAADANEAATSPSSSRPTPTYRYYVKDLGSLNGLFVNGNKLQADEWTPLDEGSRIRFGPSSQNGRAYLAAMQAIDALNADRRKNGVPVDARMALPQQQLTVRDIHVEYTFSRTMDEVCRARLAALMHPHASNALTLDEELMGGQPSAHPLPQPAPPRRLDGNVARATVRSPASASPPSARVNSIRTYMQSHTDALTRQQQQAEVHRAFYSRFASRIPADAAAPSTLLEDDDVNIAPVPRNFNPATTATMGRKRGRDSPGNNAAPSAASTGASWASMAPSSVRNDEQSAKRARTTTVARPSARGHDREEPIVIDDSNDDSSPASAQQNSAAALSSAAHSSLPSAKSPRQAIASATMRVNAAVAMSAAASTSAIAAATSSVAAAASSSSSDPSVRSAMASMLEEWQCGIVRAIRDTRGPQANREEDEDDDDHCGHSFCRSCIMEWFKKKKICPTCRDKHKGNPLPLRSADATINRIIDLCATDEEKKERAQRIKKSEEASKAQAAKDAEKAQARARSTAAAAAAAAAGAVRRLPLPARVPIAIPVPLYAPSVEVDADPEVLGYDDDDDEEEMGEDLYMPGGDLEALDAWLEHAELHGYGEDAARIEHMVYHERPLYQRRGGGARDSGERGGGSARQSRVSPAAAAAVAAAAALAASSPPVPQYAQRTHLAAASSSRAR